MNDYQQLIHTLTLTLGASWASGLNLYATIAVLGISAATGNAQLPPNLLILSNPLVIGAASLMYVVEFFADKIPGMDTAWDGVHTFIRIPAGALLAAGAVGEVSPALQIAAGILGGGLAGVTHAAKAGSRVIINTSPEPFSNWAASITEDLAVIAGLWTALHHPYIFIGLFVLFTLFLIWLLPKIARGIARIFRFMARLFDGRKKGQTASPSPPDAPPPS